ncbi:hypothetical protein AbraIFM66951_000494 [Aspergillus brasiliensis]|uniref:Jacalin-type lectin domain-containing protein n=1 Tax=Aspergillus brasiliensis TaxID=319629 RepID=A0A9W5YYW0_9EURO|nr:hypothetical protein AbraCBS73388_000473 [Aspergillus brasiliensis]GKZ48433.1 hypothetical protein AbraIFM66951_000494 [Aspergillus brasiliensis]
MAPLALSMRPWADPNVKALKGKKITDLPLTGSKPVGGINDGKSFNAHGDDGPIRSIEIGRSGKSLTAIKLGFFNTKDEQVYGDLSKSTETRSIEFGPAERVTRLLVWPTSDGSAVARVELLTSRGRELEIGEKPSDTMPVAEELGSGLLVVVTGSVSDRLASVGFRCVAGTLRIVPPVRVYNIRFPRDPGPTDITSAVFYGQNYRNDTQRPVDWAFSRSEDVTSEQHWMQSKTEHFEASVTVGGGFFGLEASASTGWSLDNTTEHGTSESVTNSLTWSMNGQVDSGEMVRVESQATAGKFSSDYLYDCEVYVASGIPGLFPITLYDLTGWYSGGLYGDGTIHAKSV